METIKCLIDTETGGLNPLVHSLLSVAIIPLDINDEPIIDKMFTANMYDNNYKIELDAIKINGLFDYQKFPSYKQTFLDFLKWLKINDITGISPIGHHTDFDLGFLRTWLGEEFKVFNTRDTRCTLRILKFLKDCGLYEGKLSLTAACEAFEIDNLNHHNAINDALVAGELYKSIVNRFRINK